MLDCAGIARGGVKYSIVESCATAHIIKEYARGRALMGWTKSKESRGSRRISSEMPVRFSVMAGEEEPRGLERATSANISTSGLAFVTSTELPIDSRLYIEVVLPANRGLLICEAVIMRITRELPDEHRWECAVRFDEGTVEDQKLLEEYVRSIDVVPLLEGMIHEGASALHLSAHTPPLFRVGRKLVQADRRSLSPDLVEALAFSTMNTDHRNRIRQTQEIDFPFMIPEVGRWRVSVCRQRGSIEVNFHKVNQYVPTLEELGMPDVVKTLALGGRGGLLAVTGGGSSGKSTTLAALVDAINHEQEKVIVTIEEPVEYIHENVRSLVIQREVGSDTESFAHAIGHVMRQDPDVVVIDRISDTESMDRVLRIAESGRLVITSFPTISITETVRHIVCMYPPERRLLVFRALSNALRVVISQILLPTVNEEGYALAVEIAMVNDSIRNTIRAGNIEGIDTIGTSAAGSISFDTSLKNLVALGKITASTAAAVTRNPES